MASIMDRIEQYIIEAVKRATAQKTSPYDDEAEVIRIEGDTAWVHFAGGVPETPVKMTVDAKKGDKVQCRVSNNGAFIIGNGTSPPTDDTRANEARSEAVNAKGAADEAWNKAKTAADAAESAQTSAAAASAAADLAQESADEAQVSAQNASAYASRALGNLATVQSVTETLTWITQHGTMALTSDTELDPTHVYFVRDANGDYTVGSYKYSIVSEPDVEDISTYYELTIDESLNNYVGTHLAITSEGLWLLPASSNTNKVLIATGAGSTYTTAGTYIIDSNGAVLAKYTANGITIGADDGTQSYLFEDYHSLQLIDRGEHTYFYVSDLRDTTGKTTWTDTFTGNGTNRSFNLLLEATDTSYTVSVSDGSGGTVSRSTTEVIFSSAPTDGATITVTYQTAQYQAKAYTFGFRIGVTAPMSVAEGINITASGYASHAEGVYTTASGGKSHAEGWSTTASGGCSHAEGYVTTASGSGGSHAEGEFAKASGDSSHAEGDHVTASGYASHAEGYRTTASGGWSHAEGYATTASGNCSHVQGDHVIAGYSEQTALGRYNNNTQDALEIGNGISDNARSNALTVAWNGNVAIAGTLTQNSDRRLKKHVLFLDEDAVQFIRELKPVHYIKNEENHVGFYAQDIESIDPWNCMVSEDSNGYKTLGYTEIIAPLVAYCQQLEERIAKLEGKEK